jgi:hypothetical protein
MLSPVHIFIYVSFKDAILQKGAYALELLRYAYIYVIVVFFTTASRLLPPPRTPV